MKNWWFFVAFTFVFSITSSVFADLVINVDVGGNNNATNAPTGHMAAASDPAGAAAIWNSFQYVFNPTVNESALIASDGTGTSVGFTVTSPNQVGAFRRQDVAGTDPVLGDYLFDNTSPAASRQLILGLNGLDASMTYDLYVYGGLQFVDGNAATQTLTVVGGATNTISFDGITDESYVEGLNYTVFTGLTGSSAFDIAIVSTSGDEPTLSGFQLVGTGAVPEPSSLALLGIAGSVGLAFNRRRSSKQARSA